MPFFYVADLNIFPKITPAHFGGLGLDWARRNPPCTGVAAAMPSHCALVDAALGDRSNAREMSVCPPPFPGPQIQQVVGVNFGRFASSERERSARRRNVISRDTRQFPNVHYNLIGSPVYCRMDFHGLVVFRKSFLTHPQSPACRCGVGRDRRRQ